MDLKLKSRTGLLAFIFLYPITPWYIAIGPLNLVNLLSIGFIIWWILCSDAKIASFSRTSLFFWIYLIVYSVQALYDASLLRAIAYITAQLIVCVILYSEIRKQEILDNTLDMMIYAGGILCVTGIFEELTRINIFHIISRLDASYFYSEVRLGFFRIATSFSHPIVYCTYLCFIAGLVVYRLNKIDNQKQVRIFKVIYVLVLLNALFTMSRSTLLVLIVEQIILVYKTGNMKFSKKRLLIFLVIVVVFTGAFALELPVMEKLKDIGYMFMALFDNKYTSLFSTFFGMNESGIGNRMDLYYWVADAVKGHEFLGMGTSTEFAYSVHAVDSKWYYFYTWTKTSIENEYLYNYYIHGLIGLVTFSLCMISSILYAFKTNRLRRNLRNHVNVYNEKTLTFSSVMCTLLIGYMVTLFSVRSSDNVRMFNTLMCLLFGYYFDLKRLRVGENIDGK